MKPASVLLVIDSLKPSSPKRVIEQIGRAKDAVTDGRYLIVLFPSPRDWKPQPTIESWVIDETLGQPRSRGEDWEFFGNGVVRTYSKELAPSQVWQWVVVRRAGDKPYRRIKSLPETTMDANRIPVSDPVFTRDVANNVWNLPDASVIENCVGRFSRLLTWGDESFYVLRNGEMTPVKNRQALNLKNDLVGVPHKTHYGFFDEPDLFSDQ